MIDLRCKTSLLHYNDAVLSEMFSQYDRTVESLQKDVQIIRDWLKTQKHLPCEPSEREIITFLAMNKFSFEETKVKLEMKFSIKSLLPEFFEYPPKHPKIIQVSKAYFFCPLPKLSKNFNRICVSKCMDASKIDSIDTILNHILHVMELRLIYDCCNSDEYIIDFEYVTLGLVALAGPMELKKIATIAEKVYSNRIAAVHFVNVPPYAETVINVLRMILKEKLRERIKVHKDLDSIQKCFSLNILPKDYGGDEKSLAELRDEMQKFLMENNDYLEQNFRQRVNENLRPMKLDNDEILGFHGNFRKLQVD